MTGAKNVKNDRYHKLGRNSVMKALNYVMDGDLFRKAGVTKELRAPKYFASDKLVTFLSS